MSEPVLRVDGAVARPTAFTFADLDRYEGDARVDDVSALDDRRTGTAVRLAALLDRVDPTSEAVSLVVHATTDGYAATVPLDAVRERAILIFAHAGEPLPTERGGPVRFLIPHPDACGTSDLDACANVKFVDRIEVRGT